jgi:hypothetical protein
MLHFTTQSWCVLYISYNKQPSFLYTVNWSFYWQHTGWSVRYELNGYTKCREILVFKVAIVWLCRIFSWCTNVQTRQAMYTYFNMRCTCVINVAIERNKYNTFWVHVCRPCKAHVPIILSYVACLYDIFSHCLITAWFLGKNVIEHKTCFDFFYKFVWNISHSKNNSARYYHKSTYIIM